MMKVNFICLKLFHEGIGENTFITYFQKQKWNPQVDQALQRGEVPEGMQVGMEVILLLNTY